MNNYNDSSFDKYIKIDNLKLSFYYLNKKEEYILKLNENSMIHMYDVLEEIKPLLLEYEKNKEEILKLDDELVFFFENLVLFHKFSDYSNKLDELTETLLQSENKNNILKGDFLLINMYMDDQEEMTKEEKTIISESVQNSIEKLFNDSRLQLKETDIYSILDIIGNANFYTNRYDSKKLKKFQNNINERTISDILEEISKK